MAHGVLAKYRECSNNEMKEYVVVERNKNIVE